MSTTSKQDRQGSRTPADLERKYDLGSMGDRFAEVMGIALDAQTHSEAALDAIEQTNSVVANISEEVDRISITVKDLDNVTSAEFLIGVINGQSTAKISADKLDIAGKKLNIKVDAANIEGRVTFGQLPQNVVDTATLKWWLPELGYQTETGVTSIVNGIVTTDYVNALGITVNAANITGKLTANQIDAAELKVDAANITGKLTADQIDVNNLSALGANIGPFSITDNGLEYWVSGSNSQNGTTIKSDGIYVGHETLTGFQYTAIQDGLLWIANVETGGSYKKKIMQVTGQGNIVSVYVDTKNKTITVE